MQMGDVVVCDVQCSDGIYGLNSVPSSRQERPASKYSRYIGDKSIDLSRRDGTGRNKRRRGGRGKSVYGTAIMIIKAVTSRSAAMAMGQVAKETASVS